MHPLLLAAIILLAIAVFGFVAARLTRTDPRPQTVEIEAPRDRVVETLERVEELPSWSSNIESVEGSDAPGTHVQRWRDGTDRTVRVERSGLPNALVWSYAVELPMGDAAPATGRWTFELADLGSRTRVTIDVREDEHSAGFELFQMVRGRSSDAVLFLEELKDRVEHPGETPARPADEQA